MASEPKPSAEIQALVMNLWNVLRDVSQAHAASQSIITTFEQRCKSLQEQLQEEQERNSKLQAYIENLQNEHKNLQHTFDELHQQHTATLKDCRQHEDERHKLLQRCEAQEQRIVQQQQENMRLQSQLHELQQHLATQEERSKVTIEALKSDLSQSRQQALSVASEFDELREEFDNLRNERNIFYEENEQLQSRISALEHHREQERVAWEKQLEEARVALQQVSMQLEDTRRVAEESNERIRILTEERSHMQELLEKAKQEAETWQYIAEEQAAKLATLQATEQTLRQKILAD
ncbi:MAG: hypothetical protein RML40_05780, partial [Bacteroidota bacterium]|nr:hypothetical protein [Candidatus Kapabacteria bacterium]MDW8220023.1 hypothetical protein [Bacteroidota bacterium]